MTSHREAALDRHRGPARPWLGNRPATSSLGGGRGRLIVDTCATGAAPRGRSIMVSSSLLGHGNAAPWSSPRPSSICSSGKKKSHPPVLGSAPLKARPIQNVHDTVASGPFRSIPAKVSMVTLTTAMGRRVDVEQLVTTAEIARRLGLEGPGQTDTPTSTLRGRLPGARTPSWSRGAWTTDLVLAAVERWARGRRAGGRARRG